MKKMGIIKLFSPVIALLVLAGCGGGNPATPPPVTPSAPSSPVNIKAAPGDKLNTIIWDNVTGANSYNLYWSASAGATKATGTKLANVTSPYSHTALTNGTTYYYVVTAVNSNGESAESAEASATPTAAPVPPPPPSNTQAVSGNSQNTISWDPAAGATGYNLYWSNTPAVTKASGTKVANVTSPYSHQGLINGSTYYYVITSINGVGESAESGEASATPAAPPPPAPANAAAASGVNKNTITWNTVATANSYNLYWSNSPGVTKANGTSIPNVTSGYQHVGLTAGTTYYYVVTAVNADGESVASNETSATPSAPPAPAATTSAATNVASSSATLNGTVNPNGYVTTYSFEWGTTVAYGSSTASQGAGAGATGLAVTANLIGLQGGTTYHYRLVAQNSGGTTYGADQSFTTLPPPPAPTGVTATKKTSFLSTNGKIQIAWTNVTGATSYNIYRSTVSGVNKTNGTKIAGVSSGYIDQNLTVGTTYYYVVTAVNANGESVESAQVSAKP